jgi:peptidoglycan/LPS O-acetylase OafA/YrhL
MAHHPNIKPGPDRLTDGRLAHIDAIRAVAALLVVIMHCATLDAFASNASWLAWTANTFDFGRIGVVLFFGVSGFVIPGSLKAGEHPGTFWVRRFFRLYPVYWLSILLVLATQWMFFAKSFSLYQIIANLTMLQNFLHAENLEGVYWTLKLELMFYVACYLLFAANVLHRAALLASISLGLTLVFLCYLDFWQGPFGFARHAANLLGLSSHGATAATSSGDNHPIPGLLNMNWGYFCAYFSIMFFGAALRRWFEGVAGTAARGLLLIIGAIWAIGLPAWGVAAYGVSHVMGTLTVFAPCALAFALFVVLTLWVRITARSMALVGLVSYSLYLMHPIVIDAIVWTGRKVHADVFGSFPVFVLVCTLLALLMAFACYAVFEHPYIEAGRTLARRLNARSQPVQTQR